MGKRAMVIVGQRLDTAILWTLLYADVFDFPMTLREIHHFLIDTRASYEEVERALLTPSVELAPHIAQRTHEGETYFALQSRAEQVFATRQHLPPANIVPPCQPSYGKRRTGME
jgi:hypothetical protein